MQQYNRFIDMSDNLKYIKSTALPLFILVWLVSMTIGPVMFVAGNDPHLPCDQNIYSGTVGTQDLVNVNLDTDQIATGICIKSGSNMFGGGHSGILGNGDYENSCYSVSGVGTNNITVTRNSDSNTCQGISHIDINYIATTSTPTPFVTPSPSATPSASPSMTPSPTPVVTGTPSGTPTSTPTQKPTFTPSPTPVITATPSPSTKPTPVVTSTPSPTATPNTTTTPDPTNSPTPDPEKSPDPRPTDSPTPTATPTPELTPSPTPTPTDSGNDDNNDGGSDSGGVGGTTDSQGEVLGATTLADTGTVKEDLGRIVSVLGLILVSISAYGYTQIKRKENKKA